MKKLIIAMVVLGILASGTSAVDMTGKIGLGAGWQTGAICLPGCCPTFGLTRIGLAPRLVLQPIVVSSVTQTSTEDGSTTYNLVFSPSLDFALRANDKGNVYGIGGIILSYKSDDTDTSSTTSFGIRAGFGIEYFVWYNFAVFLSTMSAITYSSGSDSKTTLSLSNQVVNIAIVWYN